MKKLNIALIMVFLTGCQQQNTYDYYMLHPKELKKEYTRCQTVKAPHCEAVTRAADDFTELLEDESNDPEAFGQKIIQLQSELSTLSGAEYQNAKKKLDIMYAVVGMRSPE